MQKHFEREHAGPHRYIINRGTFSGLYGQFKLTSFKLLFDLIDLLAAEHRQRVSVARRWLEVNDLIEPAIDRVLLPHSPEWFATMRLWDPVKAAQTKFVVEDAGRDGVCSICGDDPARDYRLEKSFRPAGGADTLRLCDEGQWASRSKRFRYSGANYLQARTGTQHSDWHRWNFHVVDNIGGSLRTEINVEASSAFGRRAEQTSTQ